VLGAGLAAAEPGAWPASVALVRVELVTSDVFTSAEPRPPLTSGGRPFIIWSGEEWEAVEEGLGMPEGAGALLAGAAAVAGAAVVGAAVVPDGAGGALGPAVEIAACGVSGISSIEVLASFEDVACRIGAMTGSMAIQAVCMTRRGRFGGAPGGSVAPARKNAAEATAAKP
jgi:hypothetical protein